MRCSLIRLVRRSVRCFSARDTLGGVQRADYSNTGRWTHSQVPADIKTGHAPNPAGWGLPSAMIVSDSSCKTTSLIKSQSIVVSLNFF